MLLKFVAIALSWQFSVEVHRPFTIEVNSPPAVETPLTVIPLRETPRRRSVFLAMWTASYCGPCQQWKRAVKPRLQANGIYVREYEMTDAKWQSRFGGRISSVPAFAVIDSETGEWLTDRKIGGISYDEAMAMISGVSEAPRTEQVFQQRQVTVSPPNRFIQWPGWGQIDLETYNRNCNCGMCQSIRGLQQQYRQQLQLFQQPQSKVTPDQEGTPDALVQDLLDKMQLRPGDVLAELGCGDGRILIAAAKRGIRGIGIELDPSRAQVARQNVQRSGLSELITVETGDALEFDMSRATVATTYLYPPLLAKLSPKLKSLRVVGSPYHEVPGLPMTQYGDVWIYRNGEFDENIVANNVVGNLRGDRSVAGTSADSAR